MNEPGNTPADKNYKPSGIVNDLDEGQIKAVQLTDGTYITEKLARSMTKAQAAAFRAFPGQPFIHDRCVFRMGYEAAEKDLGWISVKDRLPDTTEYVFTCVEMQGRPQCVGFHFYKDGKWWEGYEEDTVGAVEYWMQIPKFKEAKE